METDQPEGVSDVFLKIMLSLLRAVYLKYERNHGDRLVKRLFHVQHRLYQSTRQVYPMSGKDQYLRDMQETGNIKEKQAPAWATKGIQA